MVRLSPILLLISMQLFAEQYTVQLVCSKSETDAIKVMQIAESKGLDTRVITKDGRYGVTTHFGEKKEVQNLLGLSRAVKKDAFIRSTNGMKVVDTKSSLNDSSYNRTHASLTTVQVVSLKEDTNVQEYLEKTINLGFLPSVRKGKNGFKAITIGTYGCKKEASIALKSLKNYFHDAFLRPIGDLEDPQFKSEEPMIVKEKPSKIKRETIYYFDCNYVNKRFEIPEDDYSENISVRYECKDNIDNNGSM